MKLYKYITKLWWYFFLANDYNNYTQGAVARVLMRAKPASAMTPASLISDIDYIVMMECITLDDDDDDDQWWRWRWVIIMVFSQFSLFLRHKWWNPVFCVFSSWFSVFLQRLLPGLPWPLPGGSHLMCRKMRVNHLRLHFHLLWICSLCFLVVTFITIIVITIVLIMIFGKLPDAAVFTLRANYDPSLPCQCNDKCPQYGSLSHNFKTNAHNMVVLVIILNQMPTIW